MSNSKKPYDPFVGFRRNSSSDNEQIQKFLESGGKVINLVTPDKNFRESPKNNGVFVFSREERLDRR